MSDDENWQHSVVLQIFLSKWLDAASSECFLKDLEEAALEFLNTALQKSLSCLYVDTQLNSKLKDNATPQKLCTALGTYKKKLIFLKKMKISSGQTQNSIFCLFYRSSFTSLF